MTLMFGSAFNTNLGVRRSLNTLIRGTALVLVAGAVSAGANQITTASDFGPFHVSAGEFTVMPDQSLSGLLGGYSPYTRNYVQEGTFQTFCVERNENITPGTTYDVTLNNMTMFSFVPLPAGVAYLYEQFATGNLPYNYVDVPVGGRTTVGFADALMLQNALWFFMGEYSGQENNPYVVQANNALGGVNATFAPDNGAHHVSIMNLWAPGQRHDSQHSYQDLLIYTPVPEPSTAALLSLAALLGLRRRKS
jgi:hypothetical protein